MSKSQILKSLILCMALMSFGHFSHALTGEKEGKAPLHADYTKGNPIQSMVIVNTVLAEGRGSKLCGGLLISRTQVLTALHCVNSTNRTKVLIFFPKQRDSAASTSTGFFGGEEKRYARAILEPQVATILPGTNIPVGINDSNVRSPVIDAAIIELTEAAPSDVPVFSYKNLATDEDLRSGKLSSFGWDSSEFSYNGADYKNLYRKEDRQVHLSDPDLLRQFFSSDIRHYCLKSELSPNGTCSNPALMRSLYGRSTSSYKILVSTSNSFCEGDSGSPLFVRTKNNEYKLVGVTSSGFGLNGRIVSPSLAGEVECSPHLFYQTMVPLKKWLQSVVK